MLSQPIPSAHTKQAEAHDRISAQHYFFIVNILFAMHKLSAI